MSAIAIAVDDVGVAVRIQELLEASGHHVTWDAALAAGPPRDLAHTPDVIVLSGDTDAVRLSEAVRAWRAHASPPAVVIVGTTDAAAGLAGSLKATFVRAAMAEAELEPAIAHAARFRHAIDMSRLSARGVLGLARVADPTQDAIRIVRGARQADVELVRQALRPNVFHYAAANEMIEALREQRALDIPEVELTHLLDGARTVTTAVNDSRLDATAAARTLWALVSIGAVAVTPEPPDRSTIKRRAVAELRDHIRARQTRLARASCYDVLEVRRGGTLSDIDQAYRMLAIRFAPDRLSAIDLGDMRPLTGPLWEQIVKAEEILRDETSRARYNQMLAARPVGSLSPWASGQMDRAAGETLYARGQAALVAGDAFKAVSAMAAACRACPDFPDYEVSLAWARYRADLARGNPREPAIARERASAERVLAGRRPWPRALVALAMLCTAGDDPDAARWHLREALACDPRLPIAQQLLGRLLRPSAG